MRLIRLRVSGKPQRLMSTLYRLAVVVGSIQGVRASAAALWLSFRNAIAVAACSGRHASY